MLDGGETPADIENATGLNLNEVERTQCATCAKALVKKAPSESGNFKIDLNLLNVYLPDLLPIK